MLVSPVLCLLLSRSLIAKSAESDDKERYFPSFPTCLLKALGFGKEAGDVPLSGLPVRKKEKIDGGNLGEDSGFVWIQGGSAFIGLMGSEHCTSNESSHFTRLGFIPSSPDSNFFGSLSALLENMLSPMGLDVFEFGLVMSGVAGGVRREDAVTEVGDVRAGVTEGLSRDELGVV